MPPRSLALALAVSASSVLAADPPEPKFRAVTIDDKIQIGYGVAVADVDGDGKPDVLLADKKQFVWYRNPTWEKFVLAENLTEKDNVCLAAQDLDGDGKCEIAVGGEWNPSDTEKSGAVFYLIPPADRTQRWEPVKFPSVEPTTHRMKWLRLEDDVDKAKGPARWGLVVVPLHGRGNKNGEGAPVKVIRYHKPADPRAEWKAEVIDESMHMTHNFDTNLPYPEPALLIVGKEGFAGFIQQEGGTWMRSLASSAYSNHAGGEVRFGFRAPRRSTFACTIEPMHGNALVFYDGYKETGRRVLSEQINEGHALACGPILGGTTDQIVIGFRGNPQKPRPVGIKLFTPLDDNAEQWRESLIDDNGMACEDLVLADLNADGKLDIVASGRATKNVKLYFNETVR
jgi:hypothetical protein